MKHWKERLTEKVINLRLNPATLKLSERTKLCPRPEFFKSLDLNFISGKLPEGNVILNSCDSGFFNKYGWGLLYSSIKHGNKIHFNIHLNPNDPLFRSPEDICKISSDLITISTCGFLPDELKDPDEHDLRIYLSCSRVLAAEQLLKKTSANFIILDADSLVRGKLPMPPTPIGLHYRMPSWRQYIGYYERDLKGFRNSAEWEKPLTEAFLKRKHYSQIKTLDEGSNYDVENRLTFDRHQYQILMTPTYLSNCEDSRRFVSLWIYEIKNNPFLWGIVQGSGYRAWVRWLSAERHCLKEASIPDNPKIAFEFIDLEKAKRTFYNFNHPYVLDHTRFPELKCKPINNLPDDWYLPNVNIDSENGCKYNDTCFEDFSEEALIWDGKGINKEVSDKYKEYFNELTSGVGLPRYSFSLNTTPTRLNERKCLQRAIESLLNQSFPPDKVFLCIPYTYKRFKDQIPAKLPNWLKELPNVEVLRGDDYGPASRYVYVQGHDGLICSADDDVIYKRDALEKLLNFKVLNKLDAACHWSYFWWDSPTPEKDGGNANLTVDTSIKYLQGVDMILFDLSLLEGYSDFVKSCHDAHEDSFLWDDLTLSYYLQYKGFKIDSVSKGESVSTYKEQSTSKDEFRLTDDAAGRGERYLKTFETIWYLKKNYPIKKLSI